MKELNPPAIVCEVSSERIARINSMHRANSEAMEGIVKRSPMIGQDLIAEKALLNHGEWLPWLAKNVTFSRRQAARYMKASQMGTLSHLNEAIHELTGPCPEEQEKVVEEVTSNVPNETEGDGEHVAPENPPEPEPENETGENGGPEEAVVQPTVVTPSEVKTVTVTIPAPLPQLVPGKPCPLCAHLVPMPVVIDDRSVAPDGSKVCANCQRRGRTPRCVDCEILNGLRKSPKPERELVEVVCISCELLPRPVKGCKACAVRRSYAAN